MIKRVERSDDWNPKHLDVFAALFVATVLISNVAATKLFQLGPTTFTAGILVFPISYILGDVLTEVYGFNRTRKLIYVGLVANLFMAFVLTVAIYLPPAPGWPLQTEFVAIHSLAPRIVVASVVAYAAGELVNSLVMSQLKVAMNGKILWIRTVSSTFAGQGVDTLLFVIIAFAGVIGAETMISAIISGWLFKVSYEVIATPLTYFVVNKLKRSEGVDYYDAQETRRLI